MGKKKKKFKLLDAILATVCITLVAESVPASAAIGNSQYFWWIFLIIYFVGKQGRAMRLCFCFFLRHAHPTLTRHCQCGGALCRQARAP